MLPLSLKMRSLPPGPGAGGEPAGVLRARNVGYSDWLGLARLGGLSQ